MRNRTLPLALLIAASLAPIAGCGDNDESANNQSNNANAAADQSTDSAGQTSSSDAPASSPIPVNDPNKADDTTRTSPQTNAASPAPDRVKQLAQQIETIKQTDQKRLDRQSQRIDTLEQQVAALTKRLRRLRQPTSGQNKPGNPRAKTDNAPTPDAVSPQSEDSASQDDAKNAGPSGDSGDDESADDGDTVSESSGAPPASSQVSGSNIITHCGAADDTSSQFDVFFQAASDDALDAATAKVKSAGLTDWFARTSIQRLYVGRYGTCPLAARRRKDVHERTGLAVNIRAVAPRHASGAQSAPQQRSTHDYGAAHNDIASIRRAATEPVRPVTNSAPFEIVGVEIRGTHQFLGVAAHNASRLGNVTWLSTGDSYGSWTLRAIRTDAGTATFEQDGRTVAVALPQRG